MTALPAQFRDVLATLPSVAHLAALTLRDASGASVARLEEAFPGRTLVFPSCDSGNAIAFAERLA